ncbi:MAG: hypothetical protein B6I20_02485 [Bacteroidetes bacterium 4572_117]|nr:MAG: hypothetical protein B6I20_02485 [Bacteroidetes bacterium 4572_117]
MDKAKLTDLNIVVGDKIIHSKTDIKKYRYASIVLFFLLLLLYPFLSATTRTGSYEFNAILQSIGPLFAIIVGLAFLGKSSWNGDRNLLFLGLAYFFCGLIEFAHGSFSFISLLYQTKIPIHIILKIVEATEIMPELFLLTLIALSLLAHKFFRKTRIPKIEILLFASVTFTLVLIMIIISYNIQYKQMVNYERGVSHPINFLFALVFLIVALLYLFLYYKDKEMLKWWIFLSLTILMISQIYISVSKFQFDALFEVGLILKVIGYLVMLWGVFLYMIIRLRQMDKADAKLIEQKGKLQEAVSKQTVELKNKNKVLQDQILLKDELNQSLKIEGVDLKKSEEHFRELFENSIIGMYQTRADGEIITANIALCKLLGFGSFSELKNYNYKTHDFLNTGEHEKFIKLINEKGFVAGFETQWLSKNKKIIYVRESAKRKILRNNEIIFEGTVEDITIQKLAEKQRKRTAKELKNIIETVNVPIFGINKNKEIKIWNLSTEETTGYLKNEVVGKALTDNKIRGIFGDEIINMTNKAILGEEISDFESFLNPKTGNALRFLLNVTIQFNNLDNVTDVIFIAHNITILDMYKNVLEKKVEERTHELKIALNKEKELRELKSRFVTMASHEFRTPLAAISFAAGFMQKYWDRLNKDKREEKLLKIEEQVSHMIFLLDNVLTIGEAEAGKAKISCEYFNFHEFFDPIIEEICNATSNTHEIRYVNTAADCKIYIDKNMGRNIFINLLTNAIKFSPGANFVNLESKKLNNYTVIDIIDFGIGISEAETDNVFLPFHRAKNVKTIQGTGLGLAIVHELVEQHKGRITVKSIVGKGTRFTVMLPFPKNK